MHYDGIFGPEPPFRPGLITKELRKSEYGTVADILKRLNLSLLSIPWIALGVPDYPWLRKCSDGFFWLIIHNPGPNGRGIYAAAREHDIYEFIKWLSHQVLLGSN